MFRVEDVHWWYRALRRVLGIQLERFVPGARAARVLDAGCGTGANLAHLGGARWVGLDRAPEALARCRRRGLQRLVEADVSKLPFADGSFDAAISASVLYHAWVPDAGRALAELRRVLVPGGVLILDVPAHESLRSDHDERVMTARRFSRGALRRLVEASGLEVRWIGHWNSLLLPAVWLARRARLSPGGRDLESAVDGDGLRNRMLDAALALEARWLRRWPIPAGVSLSCVAVRPE